MYPSDEDKELFFRMLARYNAGTASAEETAFVERYMEVQEFRATGEGTGLKNNEAIGQALQSRLFQSIRSEATQAAVKPLQRRFRWAVAAAVLLIAGGYGIWQLQQPVPQTAKVQQPVDIGPGKEGAILTLSDGKQVVLDSLGNGVVAIQGGAPVHIRNGALVYEQSAATNGLNTVVTPKGRQFHVVLPDGTKVWLNAASSISYPVAFTHRERTVVVTGEAYFEVAEQAAQPFTVKVNDSLKIQVLGTSFNVNAYTDEPAVNATLLQGSVKVVTGTQQQMLLPGQQVQAGKTVKLVKQVNTGLVMAWKDGVFAFENADLATVMRQLSRWYNIEVVFEGHVVAGTFSGEIDRSLSLKQVLNGLSNASIHYRIEEGNKLVILP